MFIRGKSIRFGCKMFLCGSDGYLYHLSIYSDKLQDTGKPLGSRVRNAMFDIVENNLTSKRLFYFYNFFTSYQLLADLSIGDVKAVGTVRENRTAAAAAEDMKAKSVMKKSDRVTCDYRSDGKVFFCKWNDN